MTEVDSSTWTGRTWYWKLFTWFCPSIPDFAFAIVKITRDCPPGSYRPAYGIECGERWDLDCKALCVSWGFNRWTLFSWDKERRR